LADEALLLFVALVGSMLNILHAFLAGPAQIGGGGHCPHKWHELLPELSEC